MASVAREHVEEIRRRKFFIGGEPHPLTDDLHQAIIKNLSAEFYAKDVQFLMELIQNAEDNDYPEDVDPSLEFVITSEDITNTGAPATLLVFNNEKGFLPNNIESICSVGHSTKKGLRGYISEKGIGFKSVFMVTAQPHIFSNGYQIRFNEKPCQQCKVGYIVPEWIEEKDPIQSAIKSIYGSDTDLPNTTLVLPLKPEQVKAVKDQLSSLHPEVLLFLSKIRRLSVREEDPRLNTVNAISISSKKNIVTLKSRDAELYTLHLTAKDDDIGNEVDRECGYYMWKQRFPVNPENKVDVRMEVEEWVITLAFPYGKRRASNLPGIYSFLPTGTITDFPFIIQADFLLASSKENILWDNKWNQGILDCVPVAFLNVFTSLVESSTEIAPVINMFSFLPVKKSSHPKLNNVRDAIKAKLMNETIVPCESYNTPHKLLCKPKEVGRLKPEFWSIMNKAMSQGVSFNNILSHGSYVVDSSFDKKEYDVILDFLEIQFIDDEWYAKCIGSSNLVMGVSEDVYIHLLLFIAQSWGSCFYKTNMKNTPLIKYVGRDGNNIGLVTPVSGRNKLLAADCDHISWLINWNTEFGCSTGKFFLPKVTQEAIQSCSEMPALVAWLKNEVKVSFVSVYEYAELVSRSVNVDRKLAVTYAHFLYTSSQKDYLWKHEVQNLCSYMPLVDKYGQVCEIRRGVLVPANGSRWVELIGPNNPWRQHDYVELGEDYVNITCDVTYFCDVTLGEKLVSFLKASDVPNLPPPNAAIPTLSSPLTKTNTFLLLTWLRKLRTSGVGLPERFLSSIKNGSWLKIYSGGSSGYSPPSESFMLDSSIGNLVQYASGLVHLPMVDEKFYGDEIRDYRDELEMIGVRFEGMDDFGKRLMDLAKLTKDNFLSVLKFIKYLGANPGTGLLLKSMRGEKWVRTTQGDIAPANSVLFSIEEWKAASEISDIPFTDQDYYGEEILSFKDELGLLGVAVKFNQNYQLVVDNLRPYVSLRCLSSEAMLLILRCIQNVQSPDKLVDHIYYAWCLKTNLGYKSPHTCFLLNPESQWGCLLQVFKESFPVIDEQFYGRSIYSMSNELKKIGVTVDFEGAIEKFTQAFEYWASSSLIEKEHVLLFLKCYRQLKQLEVNIPVDLESCIREKEWLQTRFGDYRSPDECILFSSDWEQITPFSLLPFIDDFYGGEIHEYQEELKKFGVVTDFKNCAKFLADGLVLPQDSSTLTPENVYILLESVKDLKEREKKTILGKFREKLCEKNWLKTHFGYKRPDECLLFSSDWNPFLKCNDGPFIDEEFYGSTILSYKAELNLLGVITDVNKEGCHLIANHIEFHSNFETISRIYGYLSTFKWEPVDTRIWIPRGADIGEWVIPQDCVLHDKNNLFGEHLYILENFSYDKETLDFFASTLNVKVHPSVQDYCKLWKTWETSGRQITHNECCAFWEFVVQNWYPTTEDTFSNILLKLPVLDHNSNGIFLFDKRDVFIPDDLFLTDLFLQSSYSRPIFAWFPQPGLNSLITRTKLLDIYTKLGVRTLSESARKHISSIDHDAAGSGPVPVNSKEKIIKTGLLKLILAFLAHPTLQLDPSKRHEAVSCVRALEAFEWPEKMMVQYKLTFSSGDAVDVEPRRMIHWDKHHSKLFMQKMETSCGCKYVFEYASHFAEEIAEGVLLLLEKEQLVPDLSELIRLGYLLDFDEEAVDLLMKMKNLQIYMEDLDYLFSEVNPRPGQPPTPRPKKRRGHSFVDSPSSELRSTKRQRPSDTRPL